MISINNLLGSASDVIPKGVKGALSRTVVVGEQLVTNYKNIEHAWNEAANVLNRYTGLEIKQLGDIVKDIKEGKEDPIVPTDHKSKKYSDKEKLVYIPDNLNYNTSFDAGRDQPRRPKEDRVLTDGKLTNPGSALYLLNKLVYSNPVSIPQMSAGDLNTLRGAWNYIVNKVKDREISVDQLCTPPGTANIMNQVKASKDALVTERVPSNDKESHKESHSEDPISPGIPESESEPNSNPDITKIPSSTDRTRTDDTQELIPEGYFGSMPNALPGSEGADKLTPSHLSTFDSSWTDYLSKIVTPSDSMDHFIIGEGRTYKDVYATLEELGIHQGYKYLNGFEIGGGDTWFVQLFPWKYGPDKLTLTPELPKYRLPIGKQIFSFGEDCPALSYEFTIGRTESDQIRLFKDHSINVPKGFTYELSFSVQIVDDAYDSMKKYLASYIKNIYDYGNTALVPYYYSLFEIKLFVFRRGYQLQYYADLIGIPTNFEQEYKSEESGDEHTIQIPFSIVGVVPYANPEAKVFPELVLDPESNQNGTIWKDIDILPNFDLTSDMKINQ